MRFGEPWSHDSVFYVLIRDGREHKRPWLKNIYVKPFGHKPNCAVLYHSEADGVRDGAHLHLNPRAGDSGEGGARGGVEYAHTVQRTAAIIGSAIFLVIAPGTLAVYVPWYLTHWHFAPPLFPIARVLGAALIVAGLPILLDSFARFALQGLGTPAP